MHFFHVHLTVPTKVICVHLWIELLHQALHGWWGFTPDKLSRTPQKNCVSKDFRALDVSAWPFSCCLPKMPHQHFAGCPWSPQQAPRAKRWKIHRGFFPAHGCDLAAARRPTTTFSSWHFLLGSHRLETGRKGHRDSMFPKQEIIHRPCTSSLNNN